MCVHAQQVMLAAHVQVSQMRIALIVKTTSMMIRMKFSNDVYLHFYPNALGLVRNHFNIICPVLISMIPY